MPAPRPSIQVTYDNVDVTADITKQLKSLTYRDKVTGETDELELELEDTDGFWRDSWYPQKGAKITAKIGYEGNLVDCGTFQVDEVELSGPPDTVHIRAIAAFITSKMRTKNSKANENVTLKQLAEDIAKKHELTLDDGSRTVKLKRADSTSMQSALNVLRDFAKSVSTSSDKSLTYNSIVALSQQTIRIANWLKQNGYDKEAEQLAQNLKMVTTFPSQANYGKFSTFSGAISTELKNEKDQFRTISLGLHKIKLERSTQYRETDLEYLKRIAAEYGFAFTIKGSVMVFYHQESLEKSESIAKVERVGVKSYSLKDKTSETYKGANVKSHNHKKQELVTVDINAEPQKATNGDSYNETTKEDIIEIRLRAENKQQAEAKAKAALHRHNSRLQEGNLSVEGNPLLLAGSNFELSDMGKLSGKWHITESTHTITKDGGYTTDLEVKRIARFSSDGAATKAAANAAMRTKKGDITGEADLLKSLAYSAYQCGLIETNSERYPRVDGVLTNANTIVKLLYGKKCDREAKQLQQNIEMLKTYKSRENCFKFSGFCQQIRIELIRNIK